jgi:hypothetical protein
LNEIERFRALERELGELRQENIRLTRLLKLTEGEAQPIKGSQAAWFDQEPGSVTSESAPDAKVAFFSALFGARPDVYAVPWENTRAGKAGWMPAVAGGWRKGARTEDQRYLPLTAEVLTAHLTGDPGQATDRSGVRSGGPERRVGGPRSHGRHGTTRPFRELAATRRRHRPLRR